MTGKGYTGSICRDKKENGEPFGFLFFWANSFKKRIYREIKRNVLLRRKMEVQIHEEEELIYFWSCSAAGNFIHPDQSFKTGLSGI